MPLSEDREFSPPPGDPQLELHSPRRTSKNSKVMVLMSKTLIKINKGIINIIGLMSKTLIKELKEIKKLWYCRRHLKERGKINKINKIIEVVVLMPKALIKRSRSSGINAEGINRINVLILTPKVLMKRITPQASTNTGLGEGLGESNREGFREKDDMECNKIALHISYSPGRKNREIPPNGICCKLHVKVNTFGIQKMLQNVQGSEKVVPKTVFLASVGGSKDQKHPPAPLRGPLLRFGAPLGPLFDSKHFPAFSFSSPYLARESGPITILLDSLLGPSWALFRVPDCPAKSRDETHFTVNSEKRGRALGNPLLCQRPRSTSILARRPGTLNEGCKALVAHGPWCNSSDHPPFHTAILGRAEKVISRFCVHMCLSYTSFPNCPSTSGYANPSPLPHPGGKYLFRSFSGQASCPEPRTGMNPFPLESPRRANEPIRSFDPLLMSTKTPPVSRPNSGFSCARKGRTDSCPCICHCAFSSPFPKTLSYPRMLYEPAPDTQCIKASETGLLETLRDPLPRPKNLIAKRDRNVRCPHRHEFFKKWPGLKLMAVWVSFDHLERAAYVKN
eukprot:284816529_1